MKKYLLRYILHTVSLDLERRSTQREQCGVEHDSAVTVERHVHGDEAFAGDAVWTQLAEAEWRRDLSQERHHIQMLDLPSKKNTKNKCTFDVLA